MSDGAHEATTTEERSGSFHAGSEHRARGRARATRRTAICVACGALVWAVVGLVAPAAAAAAIAVLAGLFVYLSLDGDLADADVAGIRA